MSSFLTFSHDEQEIFKVYRPTKSPVTHPRAWWRYAIQATQLQIRHCKRIDIWKIVAEQNNDVLEKLFDDHPPQKQQTQRELERLRLEVEQLRRENDTLRKMVNDVLEPSLRPTPSKSSINNDVEFFDDLDGFPQENAHYVSRRSLLSKSSSLVATDDDNDDENEDDDNTGSQLDELKSVSTLGHSNSSLMRTEDLTDGDCLPLGKSPYDTPLIAPAQQHVGVNGRKNPSPPHRKTTFGGQHRPCSQQPVELSSTTSAERHRRPTDIDATRGRSTEIHIQRLMVGSHFFLLLLFIRNI
jgi:hypothetical protein